MATGLRRLVRSMAPIVALLMVLVLLSGCGGDPASTPTTTGQAGSTPTVGEGIATPTPTPVKSDIAGGAATPTPTPQGQKPEYGGALTYGSIQANIDPYDVTGQNSTFGTIFFNGLISMKFPYDPSKGVQYVPSLATEWTQSADGTKWTFKLRQGVVWHDGKPFVADDVVATFRRLLDKDVLIAGRAVPLRNIIVSVNKVDDHTVVFDTGAPNAAFLNWVPSQSMTVLPAHKITGDLSSTDPKARWKFFGTAPAQIGLAVGTGPFVMTAFNAEIEAVGERNKNYWNKDEFGNRLPYLDKIVYRFFADPTRKLANFAAGTLTYIDGPGGAGMHPKQAKELCGNTRDPGCYTIAYPHGAYGMVMNNVNEPALRDPKVVEAARYAMDWDHIFRQAYGGRQGFMFMDQARFPETALTKEEQYKVIPWSNPDRRKEFVQKANDLIKEAGYPTGVDMTLPLYWSCAGSMGDAMAALLGSLAEGGIRAKQGCGESGVVQTELRSGRFSFATVVTAIVRVDPGIILTQTALLDSPAVASRTWRWGENQEKVDAMYRQAVTIRDDKERGEAFRNIERFMANPQFPVIPAGYSSVEMAVHGCVRNFHPGGTWDSSNWAHEKTWLTKNCR